MRPEAARSREDGPVACGHLQDRVRAAAEAGLRSGNTPLAPRLNPVRAVRRTPMVLSAESRSR